MNASRRPPGPWLRGEGPSTTGPIGEPDRLVARLCLHGGDITEDGLHLSLAEWKDLIDSELMTTRRLPRAA